MRLIEMTCPRCGALLKVDQEKKTAFCEHCGAALLIDDEVRHIQYDNPEEAGYRFEMGRQRAMAENAYQNQYQARPQHTTPPVSPKKRNIGLWVLGWIFCFPVPLTIVILRSNLDKKVKYALVAALWIIIMLMGSNKESSGSQKGASETSAGIINIQDCRACSDHDLFVLHDVSAEQVINNCL